MSKINRQPGQAATAPLKLFVLLSLISISGWLTMTQPTKAAEATSITGLWRTHTGSLVRFYNCQSRLCGKLVTSPKGLRRDKNNPNPKLRKRPLKGLTIIRSRAKVSPTKWTGTVYNFKDGKTYPGSLKLVSPKKAILTGCQSGFCQSATWRKIGKTRVTALTN